MADQAEYLRKLVLRETRWNEPHWDEDRREEAHSKDPRFARPSGLPRLWAVTGPSGAGATHVAEMLAFGLEKQAARFALIHPIDLDEIDSIGELAIVDAGASGERARQCLEAADEVIIVCTPEDDQITGAYAAIKRIYQAGAAAPFHLAVNRAASFEQGMNVWRRLQATCSRFLALDIAWLGALPVSKRFDFTRSRTGIVFTDAEAVAIEALSLRVLGRGRSMSRRRGENYPLAKITH